MSLFIENYFRTARILVEAQTVITMRSLGAIGLTEARDDEGLRMVTEKHSALMEASIAAWRAVAKGHDPVKVYSRALTPIGARTRANSRRLTRRKAPR